MPLEIRYHHDVARIDLVGIPRNIRMRIKRAIEHRLIVDPVNAGVPLKQSLHGHRRLRVGDYRVIYRIDGDMIVVLKIGHRRDVYLGVLSRVIPK